MTQEQVVVERIDDIMKLTAPEAVVIEAPIIAEKKGMGWVRENPDFRDYSLNHPEVQPLLKAIKADAPPKAMPASVDLRANCSPIEDQGALGSCTANAGVGLIEYMERRANANYIDGSRLFLYKVTRNLLHWTGDTGAWLRTTMGAMANFGVPPESYWPYVIANFDIEPTAFCYAFANDFKSLKYYRLDTVGVMPADVLARVKTNLIAGIPAMFGFTVYSSYSQTNTNGGKFPFPAPNESVVGGHAVDAVGYDDNLVIKNTGPGGPQTKGALLIRNSWGTGWGDHGYGWLPYEYILRGIAVDWWSLLSQEYVDTRQFGI